MGYCRDICSLHVSNPHMRRSRWLPLDQVKLYASSFVKGRVAGELTHSVFINSRRRQETCGSPHRRAQPWPGLKTRTLLGQTTALHMSHCGAKTKGSVPRQEEGGEGTGKEVQTDSFMWIYRGSKSRKFQKETTKMRKIRSLTGLNILIYDYKFSI